MTLPHTRSFTDCTSVTLQTWTLTLSGSHRWEQGYGLPFPTGYLTVKLFFNLAVSYKCVPWFFPDVAWLWILEEVQWLVELLCLSAARLSLSSPELLSELRQSRSRSLRHVPAHKGLTTVFSGRGRVGGRVRTAGTFDLHFSFTFLSTFFIIMKGNCQTAACDCYRGRTCLVTAPPLWTSGEHPTEMTTWWWWWW